MITEVEPKQAESRSPRLPFGKDAWDRQQTNQQKQDKNSPRYREVNELLDRAERNIEKESEVIGKLLHEMQQSQLYLVEFKTFDAYMEAKRPNLWRGTAYRWIDHAAVVTRLKHEAQRQQIEVAQLPCQAAAKHLARVKNDNELLVNWLGMCAAKQTTADLVKQFIVKKHGSPEANKDNTVKRVLWTSAEDQGDGKKMLAQYAAVEVKTKERAGKKQDFAKIKRDRLPALLHDFANFLEANEAVEFRLVVS